MLITIQSIVKRLTETESTYIDMVIDSNIIDVFYSFLNINFKVSHSISNLNASIKGIIVILVVIGFKPKFFLLPQKHTA